MTTEERYSIVLKELAARLPDAESELQFRNPFELLVATGSALTYYQTKTCRTCNIGLQTRTAMK